MIRNTSWKGRNNASW